MPKKPSKPLKVLLLSTDCGHNAYRKTYNAYGGVTYYRLVAPQKIVNKLGHEFDYFGNDQYKDGRDDFFSFLKDYDAVICKHIDNPAGAKTIAMACDYNNIPLIYDLDDNLLAVREDQPAYSTGYNQGGMKRMYAATNMSFASAFFVSTEPLKQAYQEFYKEIFDIDMPIYVLPNYIDPTLYQKYKSKTPKDNVVIGYHGSMTHDSDLQTVIPVIDKLMTEHENVYCEIVGSVRQESAIELFKNVKNPYKFACTGGTPAFDTFPQMLMEKEWSIGIAPLIDDEFNRGKSHIKYMEFSMKKIPTVASNVYPYAKNAREALLCDTAEDWYNALNKLITDQKYATEVGKKAYKHVMSEQQYKDKGQLWVDAVSSVINSYSKQA